MAARPEPGLPHRREEQARALVPPALVGMRDRPGRRGRDPGHLDRVRPVGDVEYLPSVLAVGLVVSDQIVASVPRGLDDLNGPAVRSSGGRDVADEHRASRIGHVEDGRAVRLVVAGRRVQGTPGEVAHVAPVASQGDLEGLAALQVMGPDQPCPPRLWFGNGLHGSPSACVGPAVHGGRIYIMSLHCVSSPAFGGGVEADWRSPATREQGTLSLPPTGPGLHSLFKADWFNATNTNFKMPEEHIAYPFSTMTIQRGLRELRSEGLIQAHRTIRNPETGRRFTTGPRMIYTNRFHKLPTQSVPFS